MKKYLQLAYLAILLFSATAFDECTEMWKDFWGGFMFMYIYTGDVYFQHMGKTSSSIYSIMVGEKGKIFTRTGRPPADWIEVESGTTQNLNFGKAYWDASYSIACTVGDSGTVLYSRDKGETWEILSIPSLTKNLHGFNFQEYDYSINKAHVIVCGEEGIIYKSKNSSGWTWEQVNTPTTQRLNSITTWLGLYLVVGDNGTILRSTNFGQTWEDKSVGGANLNRIIIDEFQIFPTRAWIVGDSGKIYRTTDVGVSWELKNSGTTENLYDLSFRTSYAGVTVGAKGVVKYTTDAGSSWNDDPELSSITNKDIISIAGVDTVTATAITVNNYRRNSRNSKLNYTSLQNADTTFIIDVSSKPFIGVDIEISSVPLHFALEQNYPNPFNPSTKISWQSPVSGWQTLKVYDILGNEVATLVNEYKPEGSNEVEFPNVATRHGVSLPSGVYFYQLKAGEFIATKKMLLLR